MEDTGRSLFFEGTEQPLQEFTNTNIRIPFSHKLAPCSCHSTVKATSPQAHQSTHTYRGSNQLYRALPIKMNGHQKETEKKIPPKQKTNNSNLEETENIAQKKTEKK